MLEDIYRRHVAAKTAISAHLPRLRELASGLDTVVEFGVKRGASSSALLLGAKRVISYDIAPTPEAMALKELAGERWDYRIGDSRKAEFDAADMLFIDSQHDGIHVGAELTCAADRIGRYVVGHDTITFGSVGAKGETGTHCWNYIKGQSCPEWALGVRIAFDRLMIRDPSWRIIAHYPESHGLLVLERR